MHPDAVIIVVRQTRQVVLVAAGVSAVALFMVWVVLFPPAEATFWYLCQGLLAVWLILWMTWLVGANPRLVVTTSGLEVTNWFFRYWIRSR